MANKLKSKGEEKVKEELEDVSSSQQSMSIAASLNFSECGADNQFILKFFRHKSEQHYHIPRLTQVSFDYVIPKRKITFPTHNNQETCRKGFNIQIQQIQSSIPKLLKSPNQFLPLFYVETFKKDLESTEKKNLSIASKGKNDWEFDKKPKHLLMKDKKYLKQQEELLKDPQIKKDFCHICHIEIKDYEVHIRKEQHRKNVRKNPYNKYIKEYVRFFARMRQVNKIYQVIELDNDEQDFEEVFEQFENVRQFMRVKEQRKSIKNYETLKQTNTQSKMQKCKEVCVIVPKSNHRKAKNNRLVNEEQVQQGSLRKRR